MSVGSSLDDRIFDFCSNLPVPTNFKVIQSPSKSGLVYVRYLDLDSGEILDRHPLLERAVEIALQASLPSGWKQVVDKESGYDFFVQSSSGIVSSFPPSTLPILRELASAQQQDSYSKSNTSVLPRSFEKTSSVSALSAQSAVRPNETMYPKLSTYSLRSSLRVEVEHKRSLRGLTSFFSDKLDEWSSQFIDVNTQGDHSSAAADTNIRCPEYFSGFSVRRLRFETDEPTEIIDVLSNHSFVLFEPTSERQDFHFAFAFQEQPKNHAIVCVFCVLWRTADMSSMAKFLLSRSQRASNPRVAEIKFETLEEVVCDEVALQRTEQRLGPDQTWSLVLTRSLLQMMDSSSRIRLLPGYRYSSLEHFQFPEMVHPASVVVKALQWPGFWLPADEKHHGLCFAIALLRVSNGSPQMTDYELRVCAQWTDDESSLGSSGSPRSHSNLLTADEYIRSLSSAILRTPPKWKSPGHRMYNEEAIVLKDHYSADADCNRVDANTISQEDSRQPEPAESGEYTIRSPRSTDGFVYVSNPLFREVSTRPLVMLSSPKQASGDDASLKSDLDLLQKKFAMLEHRLLSDFSMQFDRSSPMNPAEHAGSPASTLSPKSLPMLPPSSARWDAASIVALQSQNSSTVVQPQQPQSDGTLGALQLEREAAESVGSPAVVQSPSHSLLRNHARLCALVESIGLQPSSFPRVEELQRLKDDIASENVANHKLLAETCQIQSRVRRTSFTGLAKNDNIFVLSETSLGVMAVLLAEFRKRPRHLVSFLPYVEEEDLYVVVSLLVHDVFGFYSSDTTELAEVLQYCINMCRPSEVFGVFTEEVFSKPHFLACITHCAALRSDVFPFFRHIVDPMISSREFDVDLDDCRSRSEYVDRFSAIADIAAAAICRDGIVAAVPPMLSTVLSSIYHSVEALHSGSGLQCVMSAVFLIFYPACISEYLGSRKQWRRDSTCRNLAMSMFLFRGIALQRIPLLGDQFRIPGVPHLKESISDTDRSHLAIEFSAAMELAISRHHDSLSRTIMNWLRVPNAHGKRVLRAPEMTGLCVISSREVDSLLYTMVSNPRVVQQVFDSAMVTFLEPLFTAFVKSKSFAVKARESKKSSRVGEDVKKPEDRLYFDDEQQEEFYVVPCSERVDSVPPQFDSIHVLENLAWRTAHVLGELDVFNSDSSMTPERISRNFGAHIQETLSEECRVLVRDIQAHRDDFKAVLSYYRTLRHSIRLCSSMQEELKESLSELKKRSQWVLLDVLSSRKSAATLKRARTLRPSQYFAGSRTRNGGEEVYDTAGGDISASEDADGNVIEEDDDDDDGDKEEASHTSSHRRAGNGAVRAKMDGSSFSSSSSARRISFSDLFTRSAASVITSSSSSDAATPPGTPLSRSSSSSNASRPPNSPLAVLLSNRQRKFL
eukprot:ANDGO_01946.mRNA.1 hypothetical protein